MSIGIFRFGDFELDSHSGELRKRGRALRLQQQPAQVLAMLVAARGEMVTREELRDRIWGRETYVDFDRAINSAAIVAYAANHPAWSAIISAPAPATSIAMRYPV